MIVRLTDAQLSACYALAPPAAEAWLGRGERVGRRQQDVPMPPIGWRKLTERMAAEAFNVYGQRDGRAKGSTHRAIRRISLALATLEAHPCWSQFNALPGEHHQVFTGWPSGGCYSPYPNEHEADALLPEWRTIGGLRVTIWKGYRPSSWSAPVLDPAASLAFIGA